MLLAREALRLSETPADVTIAYDGEQAIRLCKEPGFKPDIIIVDLSVPKFDGFEILQRCQSPGGPPLVVFSASDRADDKRRALASGASEYVVKPSRFQPYMEAVQGIIERWGHPATSDIV